MIHVDGLSHARLQAALEQGHMPFVSQLIESDGYEALPYRCGVPSTTPFAQAGILFGDNSEIPSYRWWDKQAGLLVFALVRGCSGWFKLGGRVLDRLVQARRFENAFARGVNLIVDVCAVPR